MKPLFPRWTNKLPTIIGIAIPSLIVLVVFVVWYYFSPKFLQVGYEPIQPVEAFSHEIHAGKLHMDCRFCHSTVQKGAFAALPSTAVCMGCHNKVLKESPLLKVVVESYAQKKAIPWENIYHLPRYSHFDHSAHLAAGVGCVTCHGRVDTMPIVRQVSPMSMGWCLECHRNPLPVLRPQSELTNLIYDPKEAGYDFKLDPYYKKRSIQPPEACGACHY